MAWTEKYCSPAGGGAHDGSTAADAWTLAEAIASVAAGNRVNMIAGTYANTTNNRTFAANGTATAPIWLRGYKTAIGDMDGTPTSQRVDGTDIPLISFTTGQFAITGNNYSCSSLAITSAKSGVTASISGTNIEFARCRFYNTAANSASSSLSLGTNTTFVFHHCYFESTNTATCNIDALKQSEFHYCAVKGGDIGLRCGTQNIFIRGCAFRSQATSAITQIANGSIVFIVGCTIRGSMTNGILLGGAAATPGWSYCAENLIVSCTNGINMANATATNNVKRWNNDYYNCTNNEVGFGDSPSFYGQTESGDPNTSSTDLSLISGANAKANGAGLFEVEAYSSYLDIGAVQRQEAASGGLGNRIISATGGLIMAGHG